MNEFLKTLAGAGMHPMQGAMLDIYLENNGSFDTPPPLPVPPAPVGNPINPILGPSNPVQELMNGAVDQPFQIYEPPAERLIPRIGAPQLPQTAAPAKSAAKSAAKQKQSNAVPIPTVNPLRTVNFGALDTLREAMLEENSIYAENAVLDTKLRADNDALNNTLMAGLQASQGSDGVESSAPPKVSEDAFASGKPQINAPFRGRKANNAFKSFFNSARHLVKRRFDLNRA